MRIMVCPDIIMLPGKKMIGAERAGFQTPLKDFIALLPPVLLSSQFFRNKRFITDIQNLIRFRITEIYK